MVFFSDATSKQPSKRVPKGTSAYQAAWIVDDQEDDDDDGDDDDDDGDDSGMEEADGDTVSKKLWLRRMCNGWAGC